MRDTYNIIPTSMAVLLHALLVAVMVLTIDFTGRKPPPLPLAIKGTLVTESALAVPPPPPVEKTPEPEPVVEPRVIEPDPAEQARLAAEAEKLRQDKLVELQRLEEMRKQREAEEKRKRDEEARRQREADEARRRAEEEAELERKRAEAEKKRLEEIERQRAENERLRREAEAAALQDAVNEESERIAAMNSNEMAAYQFQLKQKVLRNWARPASAKPGLDCLVQVRQSATGEVISARIVKCEGGDAAVERSIEAAVYKASPLPLPENRLLFDPDLRFRFIPEQ